MNPHQEPGTGNQELAISFVEGLFTVTSTTMPTTSPTPQVPPLHELSLALDP